VASPPSSASQLELLSTQIAAAATPIPSTLDIALCSSGSPDSFLVRAAASLLGEGLVRQGVGTDFRLIEGPSFVVIRLSTHADASVSSLEVRRGWEELPQRADIHPDVGDPIVITPGASIVEVLTREAGPKYSYRELDDFTARIEKGIRIAPEASRVPRGGVIEATLAARYPQTRLAALGIVPAAIRGVLQTRNTTLPAGAVSAGGRELA